MSSSEDADGGSVDVLHRIAVALRGFKITPRLSLALPDYSEIANAYLADLRAKRKQSYWKKATTRIARVLLACPTCSRSELERLRNELVMTGTSKTTANYYVDAMRRCLDWAADPDRGLIQGHELGRVKKLEVTRADKRKRRRALTEAEWCALEKESIREDQRRLVPQTPIWRTLIETGLRWGELVQLRREDLDGETLCVHAKSTKTGADRFFPLSHVPDLVVILRAALPFRSPRGAKLDLDSHNALRTLYRMLKKAGIQRVKPDGRSIDIHALRWTAVTRMLRRGVPIDVVAKLIGHVDLELLQKGTYADLDVEDHREVLRKAWGPGPAPASSSRSDP